jgi:hypothetical protein
VTTPIAVEPLGSQQPRICSVPAYVSSAGQEAVELAALAGLILDPWQAFVLEHALGEREDGKWAAFEVGLVVPRQNGKGGVLEARELAGLYLLGERLIVHSAHLFDTSLEAFRRLLTLIEQTPDLERRVKRVSRSHGEEGIELKGGQRIRFRTRTKGGGRGLTGDCLMMDEAMILPEMAHGALLPTLSARPNPQVWYTASAVDQYVHEHGLVLARVRQRGLAGDDPSLAYFECSVDPEALPRARRRREEGDKRPAGPDDVDAKTAADPEAWATANPGLGIRITAGHIANERRSLEARTFAVERLNVGDWPDVDGEPETVIDLERWADLIDARSAMRDPGALAFDVSPDRSWASICAAGHRKDELAHIEVVERRRGTGWVVERLIELVERHEPLAVVCDGSSPAASLIPALEKADVDVTVASAADQAQGCGLLFDRVEQETLRHLGTPELAAALRGAKKRPIGDAAWAWSRKNSGVDITSLVGCTLALWGLLTEAGETGEAFVAFA